MLLYEAHINANEFSSRASAHKCTYYTQTCIVHNLSYIRTLAHTHRAEGSHAKSIGRFACAAAAAAAVFRIHRTRTKLTQIETDRGKDTERKTCMKTTANNNATKNHER